MGADAHRQRSLRDLVGLCLQELPLRDRTGDGLLQFNFKVSGDVTYGVGRKAKLRFNRPALHIWRQPLGLEMCEWTKPSAHEKTVAISVRPEFLIKHFLDVGKNIPPRLSAFVSTSGSEADYCLLPLTGPMIDVTTKLLSNPYEGALALTYIETLVLELLCIAVGHCGSLPYGRLEEYSPREVRCLHAARELLPQELSPAPNLKAVGLVEKVLMRGFKAVYGESISKFSHRCRMRQALNLLRDQHLSVDRVSEAIGYSHPTTFATAFRRHFGVKPIDVKRIKHRFDYWRLGEVNRVLRLEVQEFHALRPR